MIIRIVMENLIIQFFIHATRENIPPSRKVTFNLQLYSHVWACVLSVISNLMFFKINPWNDISTGFGLKQVTLHQPTDY